MALRQVFLSSPKELVKRFFEENETELIKNYPGIKKNRVERELLDWISYKGRESILDFFNFLKLGVPLEYISGRAYFFQSQFIVNSDVLIPRNETEILVEMALNELSILKKTPRVLDVGTGSGAIILSILRGANKKIEAQASDLSERALNTARQNYFHLEYAIHPDSTLDFIKGDRLENCQGVFDFIVSNPPYIKKNDDFRLVHHSVQKFEPHMALYLEDQSYEKWFTGLFKQVERHLAPKGIFIMEGHELHLDKLKNILKSLLFSDISIKMDYNQTPRFIVAKKGIN